MTAKQYSSANMQQTANKYGFSYKLNPIAASFITYASNYCEYPVLDVGAAYGINSIPLIMQDKKVIAVDISLNHLINIQDQVLNNYPDKINNLDCKLAKFPYMELKEESLDAVLLSHVLHFLSGEEIILGLQKIFQWLKPKGKVFIICYTVFNALMKPFIPEYLKREANGWLWPGFLADSSAYWDSSNPIANLLPKTLNHCSPGTFKRILKNIPYKIEFLDYIDCRYCLPLALHLAGQENMAAVISKP